MPPRVSELKVTGPAAQKLGARSISADETCSTLQNAPVYARNPNAGQPGRLFLFGRTNGGRYLTLVIEPTHDPTTWVIVTGWDSTLRQRKLQS